MELSFDILNWGGHPIRARRYVAFAGASVVRSGHHCLFKESLTVRCCNLHPFCD